MGEERDQEAELQPELQPEAGLGVDERSEWSEESRGAEQREGQPKRYSQSAGEPQEEVDHASGSDEPSTPAARGADARSMKLRRLSQASSPARPGDFGAADFGYSFATLGGTQRSKAEASSALAFKHAKFSSKSADKEDREAAVSAAGCFCTIILALVVAGAFTMALASGAAASAGAAMLALGIFLLLVTCASLCVSCCMWRVSDDDEKIEWTIRRLNNQFDDDVERVDRLRAPVFNSKQSRRGLAKAQKAANKARAQAELQAMELAAQADLEGGMLPVEVQRKRRPVVFKIDFDGDIYVSSIETLRAQISLCIAAGSRHDTVCVVLSSPGGAVSMYGLAAAQLGRVRKAGMELVVCVDSIAASGGYLMATVANRILASPFALVGSIGVVLVAHNVQKLLEKHDVRTYVLTAGKYKRTVDAFGDPTEEDQEKAVEELEVIHKIFKDHICHHRPALKDSIEDIATGEAWLAVEAKRLGLVDEILTSDEYLLDMEATHDVLAIVPKAVETGLAAQLLEGVSAKLGLSKLPSKAMQRPEAYAM